MSSTAPWTDKKLTKQERGHMAFRYLDWLLTKNVPSGGFRLLYAITQHFNEMNQFHCFPSIETLAERSSRSKPTVWEMLPKLEKLGTIEIEWGSRGSGHPNTYRLPAAFLEFYFGPEKGRRKQPQKVRRAELSKPRRAELSDEQKSSVEPSEKLGSPDKKVRPAVLSHLLATSSHKEGRGSAARTSRDDRESANNSTSDDAPNSAPHGPDPRAGDRAIQPADQAQRQPPSRDEKNIGTAANGANADADPAFAAVYRRGRDVLGVDADAVTAKLLSAYDGDAESALDTLASAEGMSDPRQYIERDIEAAERPEPRRINEQ